ncbi:hypothetical protein [Cryptosporangium sp. NPDC048952]|uniref:hypothetical protein n=1 Tax=Cryptosporangium sp. NPDC048952 TaxID=3363961 RepID=UPI003718698C
MRRVLAAVSMWVPAIAIGLSWLAWRDRLPERVASHWTNAGGPPDDTMTTTAALAGTASFAIAAAVAGAIVAIAVTSNSTVRGAFAMLGFVGGMAAGVWLVPTWLTLRAGSPDGAVLGGWVTALVACSAFAAVPYFLSTPGETPSMAAPPQHIELRPGETGAWSRTITAPLFAWVGIGLLAMGTVQIAIMRSAAALGLTPLLIAGLGIALFVRLRVTVDWRGLRVVSAALHIPLRRIPLQRIAEVGAIQVDPAEWGGWGYRWRPGKTAIVLRSGPGLAVTTTSGRRFAVTLDDPEEPAALLETLRSSR